MYDVIVIGARVAGSPTAMLLARKGYKVLLLDKASFPSDTVSTHMITVEGSAQLRRWGLLPQVEATNCPPITNIVLDLCFERYGHFQLTGFPPSIDDGFAAIYAPKRACWTRSWSTPPSPPASEVRERFTSPNCWARAAGSSASAARPRSRMVTETARIVVGADGMRSLVAETVAAPTYHVAPPLALATTPIRTMCASRVWSSSPGRTARSSPFPPTTTRRRSSSSGWTRLRRISRPTC